MRRGPRLVLLGKQGAGKGTQAARLAEHYGIRHLATGELFRDAVRAGSELGVEARRYMDAGDLVPDDVTVGLIEERLARPDVRDQGFVLDGFPRTERQALELDRILGNDPLDVVVELAVPTEVVLERIAGRRAAERRDDDTDAAVQRRLELYERQTAPLVDLYQRQERLEVVDGLGDGDEVFMRLVKVIDARL